MAGKKLPVTLTGEVAELRRMIARLRVAVGNAFDPNELPVIIGATSTAGGGSTPSDPSAGSSSAIAIGDFARALANNTVAIGDAPQALAADAIAIGDGAYASVANAIGIGNGPAATGLRAIAIGDGPAATGADSIALGSCQAIASAAVAVGLSAGADAVNSTALGTQASVSATHTHSTALGADAATTAAHQVMLGTSSDTVVVPGTLTAAGITGGGHPIAIANAGGTVNSDVSTVEFTGTAVTSVTDDGGGHVTVTVASHPIAIANAGGTVNSDVSTVEFTGTAVTSVTDDGGGHVTVTVAGGSGGAWSIVTVTNGDVLADATIALADAAGGTLALTLPDPAGNGRMTVKNTATTGNGTVQIGPFGTELIDGLSGYMDLDDGEAATLVSDGTNWWSI